MTSSAPLKEKEFMVQSNTFWKSSTHLLAAIESKTCLSRFDSDLSAVFARPVESGGRTDSLVRCAH